MKSSAQTRPNMVGQGQRAMYAVVPRTVAEAERKVLDAPSRGSEPEGVVGVGGEGAGRGEGDRAKAREKRRGEEAMKGRCEDVLCPR